MKPTTILTILMLGLILTGCSQFSTNGATGLSTKDEPLVKIGVSQAFNGPRAFIGERIRNGIEMAYGDLPEDERAKISLVYEDDNCMGAQALTAMHNLVENHEADYVIGPTCNAAILPVIDYMKEKWAVFLTTGVANDKTAKAGDNHFTIMPLTKELMMILADYAYDKEESRTLTILYIDDEFGQENFQYFRERFESRGGRIVATEKFLPSDTDFRSQLTKLKGVKSDGMFAMSYGSWLINQLKQMDELGYKTKVFGPVPVEDDNVIKNTGDLAEGLIYVYPQAAEKSKKRLDFEQRYREKYSADPELYATTAYDTFNILHGAIKSCGKDKECAKTWLSKMAGFESLEGQIAFDSDGVGKRSIVIKEIKDGKFVTIEQRS